MKMKLRPDVVAAGILGLFCVLALWLRTGFCGTQFSEYALMLECDFRIAMGQVIYRDFVWLAAPLARMIQAGLFLIFGFTLTPIRWYVSLQGVAGALLVFIILRRYLRLTPAYSLAGAVFGFLWSLQLQTGMPWHNSDAYFFVLLAVFSFFATWERGSPWGFFCFGLCCGASFWCKQDVGAAALLAGAGVIGLLWAKLENRRPAQLFSCAAGMLIPFLVFGIYFLREGCLALAWHSIAQRAIQQHWSSPGSPSLAQKLLISVFGAKNQVGKLLLLVYVVGFFLPARQALRGEEPDMCWRNACVSLFAGTVTYAGVLSHCVANFDMQQGALGCVAGIVWRALGQGREDASNVASRRWERGFRAGFWILVVFLSLRSFKYWWMNDLRRAGTGSLVAAEDPHYGGIRLPASLAEKIGAMLRFARAIPAGEDFYFFPEDGDVGIYFATGRLPPHPVTSGVEIGPEDEPAMLSALARERVRWLIVEGGGRADFHFPSIRAYIDENFAAQKELIPGLVLWRRRDV